jgi:hypothetical protein
VKIRPAATHPHTTTTRATVDAVAGPSGILPGGAPGARLPRVQAHRRLFGPVLISRPGIGAWRCDSCPRRGQGWVQIEQHYAQTGHTRFTPKGSTP